MLAPINLDERFQRELHFPMTAEEFLAWDQEDVHAEWVNGEITIFSRVINGFWFRKEWLFQEKEPDTLALLGEIRGLSDAEIQMVQRLLGGRTPNV